MKKRVKIWLKEHRKAIFHVLDDFFGNPFVFDYQKTICKLSLILVCAVLIVIRGSNLPLISDSKILHFLFYTDPNSDKTLYNIGISTVAAYIFYVFQVYLPERKKSRMNCSVFSLYLRHEIYLLNQYTLAWKEFLGKVPGECHFFEFDYKLDPRGNGAVTKQTYEETIEELPRMLETIIILRKSDFQKCDIAFQDFINNSYHTITGHLKYMDDQFPRWCDDPLEAKDYLLIQSMVMDEIKRIQRKMSSIEKYRLTVTEISPHTGKSLLEILKETE